MQPSLIARVFLPFALGFFLGFFYRTVNAVMAPDIAAEVGVDAEGLGLLTSVYFLTFALFQIPLGVLLDRYGARRVQAGLFCVTAAGAALFATADTLGLLITGRALMGLGMSAGLMAAFKAIIEWFPKERLAFWQGTLMAVGSLGAIASTVPVEASLAFTDWRGVFLYLGGFTFLTGVMILLTVPEKPGEREMRTASLTGQLKDFAEIMGDFRVWRVVPLATASLGAFMGVPSLWAGPWLRDVAGFERFGVANGLMVIGIAIMLGYIATGVFAERLARAGVSALTVSYWGIAAYTALQFLLAANLGPFDVVLWAMFGFVGASAILIFTGMAQLYPANKAGRINAALNLPVLAGAFAIQWGMGAIIDLWPEGPDGTYAVDGHRAALTAVAGLHVLAFIWLWVSGLMAGRSRDMPAE